MNIIESFEYVKTFVTKIRKDKMPNNLTICINIKCFSDDNLSSIIMFEDTIKKMCKLKEIIYYDSRRGI